MVKILVVEDNPSNMRLVSLILKKVGYLVLEAYDATKGIEIAKSDDIDLILMDMRMPGMDGYQATKELKKDEATKDIPVIALTAQAMEGDKKEILDAGCDAYLTKPINYKILEKEIAKFV